MGKKALRRADLMGFELGKPILATLGLPGVIFGISPVVQEALQEGRFNGGGARKTHFGDPGHDERNRWRRAPDPAQNPNRAATMEVNSYIHTQQPTGRGR